MLRWNTRLRKPHTGIGIDGEEMKREDLLASFLSGTRGVLRDTRDQAAGSLSKFEAAVGTPFLRANFDGAAQSTLQGAWRSLAESAAKENKRDAADDRNVAAFSRGFEFSSQEFLQPPPSQNWKEVTLGGGRLRVDKNLPFALVEKNGVAVAVLGVAIDSDAGTASSSRIAERIADSVLSEQSLDAADEHALWLGGRFVLIVGWNEQWRLHVDAMASRSCYWAVRNNQLFAASHSFLVARQLEELSRKQAYWVLSHPDYESASGKWLPGRITPHDCTGLVNANCVLSFDGQKALHSRVFPLEKHRIAKEYSPKQAARILIAELRTQTEAWLNVGERSYLALTSGQDSLVMLLAGLDLFQKRFTQAMTYIFAEKKDPSGVRDLAGANSLARLAGLQHKIVQVKPFVFKGQFAAAYKQTFPTWARFPALAKTMVENFSKRDVILFGIGGEIGTVFYRDRTDGPVSGSLLASKFTTSKFSSDPALIEEMQEYIAYTQLDSVDSSLASFYDLFYWENRMTNWAATGYSEYEFGPTIGLPFNTRRIIWPLLNVSYKDRLNKAVYKAIIRWSGWRS